MIKFVLNDNIYVNLAEKHIKFKGEIIFMNKVNARTIAVVERVCILINRKQALKNAYLLWRKLQI